MKLFLIGIGVAFALLYFASVLCSPLYFKWGIGAWFYHDIMGWHTPSEDETMFDGVNCYNVCKHCRLPIIEDSQGNWFTTDCRG